MTPRAPRQPNFRTGNNAAGRALVNAPKSELLLAGGRLTAGGRVVPNPVVPGGTPSPRASRPGYVAARDRYRNLPRSLSGTPRAA